MAEVAGSIGWTRLLASEGARPCQAPRHYQLEHVVPLAQWLVALDDLNGSPELFSLCTDCVDTIAADLGTTAERGALSRG